MNKLSDKFLEAKRISDLMGFDYNFVRDGINREKLYALMQKNGFCWDAKLKKWERIFINWR